jgi:hypothetical protein
MAASLSLPPTRQVRYLPYYTLKRDVAKSFVFDLMANHHLSYSFAQPCGPATLVTHDPERKPPVRRSIRDNVAILVLRPHRTR